jgi:hypothetical protein
MTVEGIGQKLLQSVLEKHLPSYRLAVMNPLICTASGPAWHPSVECRPSQRFLRRGSHVRRIEPHGGGIWR